MRSETKFRINTHGWGCIEKKELPICPVEATLTEIGESLRPIPGALFDWGMDYKRKNNSPAGELVDALEKALH